MADETLKNYLSAPPTDSRLSMPSSQEATRQIDATSPLAGVNMETASRGEIFRLLELVESLEKNYQRIVLNTRSLFILVSLLLFNSTVLLPFAIKWGSWAVVSFLVIVGLFGLHWTSRMLRLKREIWRGRKAYAEVLEVLHEVWQAHRENWTPLEQAEFRIRLSQLDLPDVKRPPSLLKIAFFG